VDRYDGARLRLAASAGPLVKTLTTLPGAGSSPPSTPHYVSPLPALDPALAASTPASHCIRDKRARSLTTRPFRESEAPILLTECPLTC